jgi:hypothetical protein
MKCENCDYREVKEIPDDEAFDVKGKKLNYMKDVDVCTLDNINIPCDDAYLKCEYRDIKVEVQQIKSIIHVIESYIKHPEIYSLDGVINELNDILKGEIE